MTTYSKHMKRGLDLLGASLGLVLLLPVIFFVATVVLITMGRPILFTAIRPGLDEELFTLYKFRSMDNGTNRPDAQRLTSVGRFLRRTSLDELPQLFNILRGDMSFVGPRPLAQQYLPYYTPTERLRHSVRPGLTGLAQVRGRNALTWEERFAHDLAYCSDVSLRMDAHILLLTARKVLRGSDVAIRGEGSLRDLDQERADASTPSVGTSKL